MRSSGFFFLALAPLLGSLAVRPAMAQPQPTQQPSKPLAPKATTAAELTGFVTGPWQLPTRGFSLSLPPQWKAQKFGAAPRALTCALPDASGQIRQLILVQMGVSNATSLRGHANLLLEDGDAQLVGGPLLLDKKPALRLKLSGDEPGMSKVWGQQTILLAAQGKQTFTIRIFADAGENLNETVAALQSGWRWSPFAPPSAHLATSASRSGEPQWSRSDSHPRF